MGGFNEEQHLDLQKAREMLFNVSQIYQKARPGRAVQEGRRNAFCCPQNLGSARTAYKGLAEAAACSCASTKTRDR